MDRLTKKKEDRYFEGEEFWTSAEEPDEDEIDRVYFKLADYEDIGTPQEFAELKAENKRLKEITTDIPLDRLKEICDAVRLVGKEAYFPDKDLMSHGEVVSIAYDDMWNVYCRYTNGLTYWHSLADVGVNVFIGDNAKERAEARLKELKK